MAYKSRIACVSIIHVYCSHRLKIHEEKVNYWKIEMSHLCQKLCKKYSSEKLYYIVINILITIFSVYPQECCIIYRMYWKIQTQVQTTQNIYYLNNQEEIPQKCPVMIIKNHYTWKETVYSLPFLYFFHVLYCVFSTNRVFSELHCSVGSLEWPMNTAIVINIHIFLWKRSMFNTQIIMEYFCFSLNYKSRCM